MRTYAYVITLQWRDARGPVSSTINGAADFPEGSSRNAAQAELIEQAKAAMGAQEAMAAVVFLSLEPDDL